MNIDFWDSGLATWMAYCRMGNGPKPKAAEKWRAKWPAAILGGGGGFPKWPRSGGQIAGQRKFGDFLPVRPFAWPFFFHFGNPPPPGMAASHFSAILGFGPGSHSVAGRTFLTPEPYARTSRGQERTRHTIHMDINLFVR